MTNSRCLRISSRLTPRGASIIRESRPKTDSGTHQASHGQPWQARNQHAENTGGALIIGGAVEDEFETKGHPLVAFCLVSSLFQSVSMRDLIRSTGESLRTSIR